MLYQTRHMVADTEFRIGAGRVRPGNIFACSDTDADYYRKSHRAHDYTGPEPAPEEVVWSPGASTPIVPVVEHGESQRPAPGTLTASTWSTPPEPSTEVVVEVEQGGEKPVETADKAAEQVGEGEGTSPAPIAPRKPVVAPSATLPRTAVGGRAGNKGPSPRNGRR